jgi:putative endonuclease
MDDHPPAVRRRTARRAAGDRAEAFVADRLHLAGWRILGRQVPVGRDEVDLVAVEPGGPGEPATLVFIEVRSARTERFGAPEESVAGRKAARTYRAVLALVRAGTLPDGRPLPPLAWRVDVVSVIGSPGAHGGSGAPGAGAPVRVRHLRAVDPG